MVQLLYRNWVNTLVHFAGTWKIPYTTTFCECPCSNSFSCLFLQWRKEMCLTFEDLNNKLKGWKHHEVSKMELLLWYPISTGYKHNINALEIVELLQHLFHRSFCFSTSTILLHNRAAYFPVSSTSQHQLR